MKNRSKDVDIQVIASSEAYFAEVVRSALEARRVKTIPPVEVYLVQILHQFLDSRNLFESTVPESNNMEPISPRKSNSTLAEMLLTAQNQEEPKRSELLKRVGDQALYISGFFGDSLQRKLVDVDYYVNMGGNAYRTLARSGRDDILAKVYWTISTRFVDFVDIFTHISQNSFVKSNESILRLYDRYLSTGSELAKEKLLEIGILPLNDGKPKKSA